MIQFLKFINLTLLLLQCSTGISQKFQEVFSEAASSTNKCKWFDFDNDNDLDIIIGTQTSGFLTVYRNDMGSFTKTSDFKVPCRYSFELGDFDNDNRIDVVTMEDSQTRYIMAYLSSIPENWNSYIYYGLFFRGTFDVGDFNNDGTSDLLLQGTDLYDDITEIHYIKNGRFNDEEYTLSSAIDGLAISGDYNNDGYLDVLVSGWRDPFEPVSMTLKNNKGSDFTTNFLPNTGFGASCGNWADFNNDGYMDFYLTDGGNLWNGYLFRNIYENKSGSSFFRRTGLPSDTLFVSSNACGDLNNDGYQDIISISQIANPYLFPENPVRIDLNQQNFQFKIVHDSTFNNISYGHVALGDYDNDGSVDILISGEYVVQLPTGFNEFKTFVKVFRNTTPTVNSKPDPPQTLRNTVINNNTANLSWSSGHDVETESVALSYNIYIRSESGIFAVSPLANLSTGFKKLSDRGNAFHSRVKTINNLHAGKYKWSVQSIDNSFHPSLFAFADSFSIQPTSNFSLPTHGCSNNIITAKYLGNALLDSNTIFIWSTDNGRIIRTYSTSEEFNITWDTGGWKIVTLIIIRDGLVSESTTNRINITNTPQPYFEVPKSVCLYDTIKVIYIGKSDEGTDFNFRFQDGTIVKGADRGPFDLVWNYSGHKEVSLSLNLNGCTAESSTDVFVPSLLRLDPICYADVDTSNMINIFLDDSKNQAGTITTLFRKSLNEITKPIFEYNTNFSGFITDTCVNDGSKYYSYFKKAIDKFGCSSSSSLVEPIILDYTLIGSSMLKLFWNNNYEGILDQTLYFSVGSNAHLMENDFYISSFETSYIHNYPIGENLFYRIQSEIACNCYNKETVDIYSNTIKTYIDNDSLNLTFYPNPVHDEVYIYAAINFENAPISIYDLSGNLVLNGFLNSNNIIDLSGFSSGVYILKISTNQDHFIRKILKI